MKILSAGKKRPGRLGAAAFLAPLGELIALDRQTVDGLCGDLSDLDLRVMIRQVKPDVIVNAAAYTAVDKAESETELADRVNGQASKSWPKRPRLGCLVDSLFHRLRLQRARFSAMARVRCGRPGESLRRK
jgi:hypothetical protein